MDTGLLFLGWVFLKFLILLKVFRKSFLSGTGGVVPTRETIKVPLKKRERMRWGFSI